MTMVYMNLQPPADTALRSPADWWSLTPPSHPCSSTWEGRLFSSAYTCRRRQLPFSEVERLMLPGLSSRTSRMPATDRSTAFDMQKYKKLLILSHDSSLFYASLVIRKAIFHSFFRLNRVSESLSFNRYLSINRS